jgi:pimeloyl-ACP methyl ester carboxylesterase
MEVVEVLPQRTKSPQKKCAPVNGLKMYYEIHGTANGNTPPLVLLHGGGSTIETSFGKVLPALAKTRQVIAFDQQGHGRTADIVDRPFTFEQSADDTAGLLRHLKIGKADFFGYSNGGHIVRPEHAVEMFRLLPHAQLAVLPGTDHMTLVNRADSAEWQVSMIEAFLEAPAQNHGRMEARECCLETRTR